LLGRKTGKADKLESCASEMMAFEQLKKTPLNEIRRLGDAQQLPRCFSA
jgi:hypothetical protein